ncbi:MAG: butyrate kinase [Clostridioides sp.]|jgi:butyrate kinase|nr:butyrate kinase [Clostridioides sp.]
MKMLIINIGGTSSKVAIFENENMLHTQTFRHTPEELACDDLWQQYDFRKKVIKDYCESQNLDIKNLDAIVSRGASVKPITSGVYRIDEEMIADAKSGEYGIHPCALGCQIAFELSEGMIPALTVDPPCIDEMIEIAKYTGLPELKRKSFFQALNHKAVAKRFAKQIGKKYEELNLVICHLGSGISVASHCKGKVIDVTNGLDGDAPFGLDRVGTLPAGDWMKLCFSGKYTQDELTNILNGKGGMFAYSGTSSAIEIEKKIENGDKNIEQAYDAMAFQIAKGVGGASTVFEERPDAIIFTGGLANSKYFIEKLTRRLNWITKIYIFAGEDEMYALAEGAVRGLSGEEEILKY